MDLGQIALAQHEEDGPPPLQHASGMLCDTEDQIIAIIESGGERDQQEAVEAINHGAGHKACAPVEDVYFFAGDPSRTIRGEHAELFDIVPVFLVRVGQMPVVTDNLQWTAFKSALIEATLVK